MGRIFGRKAEQEKAQRKRSGAVTAVLAAFSAVAAISKGIAAYKSSPKAQKAVDQAKSKAISFTRRKPSLATQAS